MRTGNCSVCGKPWNNNRRNAITCGAPECRDKHDRLRRRKFRAENRERLAAEQRDRHGRPESVERQKRTSSAGRRSRNLKKSGIIVKLQAGDLDSTLTPGIIKYCEEARANEIPAKKIPDRRG